MWLVCYGVGEAPEPYAPQVNGRCSETVSVRIRIPREEIAAFCRRYWVRRPAFFGSVLRDDFSPESDVEVLV